MAALSTGDNGTRRKRLELKAAVDAQSTNEDVDSSKANEDPLIT